MVERSITDDERAAALGYLLDYSKGYPSYWSEASSRFGCYGVIGTILFLPIAFMVCLFAMQFTLSYFAVAVLCGGITLGTAGAVKGLLHSRDLYRQLAQEAEEGRHEVENGIVIEYSGTIEKAWFDRDSSSTSHAIPLRVLFVGGDEVMVNALDCRRLGLREPPTKSAKIVMLPLTRLIVASESC